MKDWIISNKYIWLIGLSLTAALILGPILIFFPRTAEAEENPWAHVPERLTQTDHTFLMEGPFETGQEVTQACLACHEDAAFQVMQTAHWTWESEPVSLPARLEREHFDGFPQHAARQAPLPGAPDSVGFHGYCFHCLRLLEARISEIERRL